MCGSVPYSHAGMHASNVGRVLSDALNATPAAVEEGILPGGGIALLRASLSLATNTPGSTNPPSNLDAKILVTANFDQDIDVNIIRRALARSARTILTNAGEGPSVIGITTHTCSGGSDSNKRPVSDMTRISRG